MESWWSERKEERERMQDSDVATICMYVLLTVYPGII